MECVVQGIIETQHVEALETLLQGLCGAPKERVRVHELCLKSGPNLGVVPSEVRLLCDLALPTPTWLLHLSKPGVSTGIVPTAAAAAASLMLNSGGKTL
ncbi:Mediator of RNA polymerase II transcription subunit 18 [Ananas comosus]|uniref:Mediator of RNA polymerase II transcription subunit 18 n=1 Tax=Ananas comosus TaxID=4615 RepID=A0A199UHA9_ANACO|nr:Mediator of RNA polymerase II transcription subunit 18 [Ananas comosus]